MFAEPWQAQAFAMTVALHERGLFRWSEWAEALSRRGEEARATPTERLLRLLAARAGKAARRQGRRRHAEVEMAAAWVRAAHATPHGQPIVLENDPDGQAG